MKTKILVLAVAFALSLVVVGLALASGDVALPRWVLNGGATDATAGNIALRGTLSQPVVGVISSGDIALGQGFWHGGSLSDGKYYVHLPLVQR